MNRFLVKLLFFSIIPVLTLFGVFLLENGTSDPFYQRFITGPKKSLIIGTSRAAQGIQPEILNNMLNLENDNQLFNYSFTVMHSPYGEIYHNSIFKKLIVNEYDDGIFIVCVDPWSISSLKENPIDRNLYREKNRLLEKLWFVNNNVNFQYLLNYYENSFYEIILRRFVYSPTKLHTDGWYEINLKNISDSYPKILEEKRNQYLSSLKNSSFSKTRFDSFIKLIRELDQRGNVYLVRLPVDPEILKIDNALMPEFDNLIEKMSSVEGMPYLDLTPMSNQFNYTDGNHLLVQSGTEVTKLIGDWIRKERFHSVTSE